MYQLLLSYNVDQIWHKFLILNFTKFFKKLKIIITRTYIETFSIADDVAIAKKMNVLQSFSVFFLSFFFYYLFKYKLFFLYFNLKRKQKWNENIMILYYSH